MWPWKRKKKVVSEKEVIKFSMNKRVPIIQVELNGKKAKFLIDSGASLNILDKNAAKEYGFKTYSSSDSTVTGIGGAEEILSVGGTDVVINGKKVRMPFKSIDLSNVVSKLGIVGIIGSRWLSQQGYIIDYCDHTIYQK